MTMITYLLVFLATFCRHAESSSNTTLQLPITINPLLQDSIQRDELTNSLVQISPVFYKHVTFNDLVKNLGFTSRVPQLKKHVKSMVILGLAAKRNGLTVANLEFLNTSSKWSINITVEELANASENITIPLHSEIALIVIQEAMFTILEKKFNFKTEEVAEGLNTTVDEVYAFLEPGWIKTIQFITKKNVLALSTNYTIPPFYIAEALNMTLSELYNSTLQQLEDILTTKIDVIKEAAKRLKKSSSVVGLSTVFTTSLSMNSTVSMPMTSTVSMPMNSTVSVSMPMNSKVSVTLPMNSTVPVTLPMNSTVPMDKTTTMAIQASFITQTMTKSSSTLNEISSYQEMSYTSSPVNAKSESSSSGIVPQTSATSLIVPTMSSFKNMDSTMSSLINMESSSVAEAQKSTPTKTQSMYQIPVSMTTTQVTEKEISAILKTDTISQQVSTTQQPMLQPSTTSFVLPTKSTTMGSSISEKSSMLSGSSKMAEMASMSSKSAPVSSQEAPSSEIMEMSSSQQHMTTTGILSSTLPKSSPEMVTSSYAMEVSASRDLTKSTSNTAPTSSMGNTIYSLVMSEARSFDAVKSTSMVEMMTSMITTSFVMMTSSYETTSSETPKLTATSQMAKTTAFSEITTSSKFPRNPQTSFSEAYSSHVVPDSMTTSMKLSTYSTNLRHQQSTKKALKSSPALTTTANGLAPTKLTVPVEPTSYYQAPSPSHVPVTTTPSTTTVGLGNTAGTTGEDDIDPMLLIIIPTMAVLFLVAIILALFLWMRNRKRRKSAEHDNAESGSELSRKGLVESLENINNNSRTTGFVNRGSDDRSSRSMSRTSSVSNLDTIQEDKEPEEPEVYKLDKITSM